MTTKEEFRLAIKAIISCKATIQAGCECDPMDADWLYYQCKSYVDAYRKRFIG